MALRTASRGGGAEEIGETSDGAGERGIGGLGAVVEVDAHADDGGVGAESFDEDAGELGAADHDVVGPAEAVAGEAEGGEGVAEGEAGDEGRRIEAAGLGGLGRATASELLCLWRPYRFLPQNTATCAAVAALAGVYKKRDIEEFPYDAFMDLAATFEGAFRAEAEGAFPEFREALKARRYLYFYAFLSDK